MNSTAIVYIIMYLAAGLIGHGLAKLFSKVTTQNV